LKKILEWMVTGILILAIFLFIFMFIGPRFGWETHPVLSGSMEPALEVGGIIVTKPEKLENIQKGDIITFQTEGPKVTHRIVDIKEIEGERWFQTKGDANKEPDRDLVSSQGDVMRKVFLYLPYLGFAAQFMQSKWAFIVLVGIPSVILIGWLGKDVWEGIEEERRKKRKKEENEEDRKEGE